MAEHDTSRTPPEAEARKLDLAAMKGLAHPLRVALLDRLTTYGPNTASGLADRLGESSGATSYHLRQLERHGFVREVDGRGTARERWWERVPGAIMLPYGDDHIAADAATRAAADLISAEWERSRHALLMDFMHRGDTVLGPEWTAHAALSTASLRLTRAELAELHDRLEKSVFDIVDEYRGRSNPGARPAQVHLNLFPVVDGDPTPEEEATP